MTKPELTNAALDLSEEERAELALVLLRSLHKPDGLSDEERHLAWDSEVTDRLRAWEAGEAKSQPASEMFAELRSRLARSK